MATFIIDNMFFRFHRLLLLMATNSASSDEFASPCVLQASSRSLTHQTQDGEDSVKDTLLTVLALLLLVVLVCVCCRAPPSRCCLWFLFWGSDDSYELDSGTTSRQAHLFELTRKERKRIMKHLLEQMTVVYHKQDEEAKAGDDNNGDDEESASAASCSICLNPYLEGDSVLTGTQCTHMFHTTCAKEWIYQNSKHHDQCPNCRRDMVMPNEFREAAVVVLGEARVAELSNNETHIKRRSALADPLRGTVYGGAEARIRAVAEAAVTAAMEEEATVVMDSSTASPAAGRGIIHSANSVDLEEGNNEPEDSTRRSLEC